VFVGTGGGVAKLDKASKTRENRRSHGKWEEQDRLTSRLKS